MPTYEYKCPKCGAHFERFHQKITARPVARCPQCGGRAKRLLSGGAGLVFKGSGFYATDYKRAGEKQQAEAGESAESKPPETKPSRSSSASSKDP